MPVEWNPAARTAHVITTARDTGERISYDQHDHAVDTVARHSTVVRYWRRCTVGAVIGIPLGLLLLVIGVSALGHSRTWPTYAIAAGVLVFALLAIGQHIGIQSALTMTAGLHEAENQTPHAL